MNKCIICSKSCEGLYCFQHKPRKNLKRGTKRLGQRGKIIKPNVEMYEFFLNIWRKRSHFSEISRQYLGREPLTIFFHHILPKSKYPEAELDEENIILLTWEEHQKAEQDPYYYPEINTRREKLKQKYT